MYSTEVTHSTILSDNPLFQRTKKAYEIIKNKLSGEVLELGCGEGYGIDIYYHKNINLTLVDKSRAVTTKLQAKHPLATVFQCTIPPLKKLKDNSFDVVIAFQVIEHIKDDHLFLKEIYRVLKPGGTLFLTTPNSKKTVAPNPWHYREYTFDKLENLLATYFPKASIKGIEGNSKTDAYYQKNKKSVENILKLDFLKLHKRLPRQLLYLPFEILNRYNRKKLVQQINTTTSITVDDYSLKNYSERTLDFFCEVVK